MATGARAIIENTLAEYGLANGRANSGGTLADWAWRRYLETGDAEQVMVELRSQQAFKDRFPAYEELAKRGRALSPAEYVAYEQTVYSLLQSFGIDDGLYNTPDTVTRLLLNDVSASEFSERLAINAEASITAPDEVRDALQDMYGVGAGGMLAYYLDPDNALPKLQQQYAAAQIAGAAAERQFSMDRQQAERLATLGYTYEQARQAAQQGAAAGGLSVGSHAVSYDDLLNAGLGDVGARSRVERAIASRTAAVSGGGSAASEQSGVSGLGGASAS